MEENRLSINFSTFLCGSPLAVKEHAVKIFKQIILCRLLTGAKLEKQYNDGRLQPNLCVSPSGTKSFSKQKHKMRHHCIQMYLIMELTCDHRIK